MSFEEHIRKNLLNHPTEVDTDALWDSICDDIPNGKDQKKRGGIFFIFLIGLMSLGTVLFYPFEMKNTQAHLNISSGQEFAPDGKWDAYSLTWESPIEKRHILLEYQNPPQLLHSLEKGALITEIDKTAAFLDLARKHDVINIGSFDKNTLEKESSPLPFKEDKVKALESPSSLEEAELRFMEMIPAILSDNTPLEKISFNLKIEEEEEEEEEEEQKKIVEKNIPKFKFEIGVHMGGNFIRNSYSTNTAGHSEYVQRLNDMNTNSYSSEYLLGFRVLHKTGIFLQSGLNYRKSTTIFEYISNDIVDIRYSSSNNEQYIDDDLVPSSTKSNGIQEQTNNASNTSISSYGSTIRKHKMYTKQLNVPLLMGYQIGKGIVKMELTSGVQFGLATSYQGKIPTPENGLHEFGGFMNNSPYRNNLLMKVQNGIAMNLTLSENISLNLGSYFRFNPKSITKEDAVFSQKENEFGGSLGLRFNLK